MRIPSGVTDQYIYFVAVDSTDFTTRETGLTTFTVYRSRDGAASSAMTTPTVNETDATNMPGVYELLLDEDMTIGSGNDSEEMCFHITQASMAPVTRTIELYRPKITVGSTSTAQTGDSYARIGATGSGLTSLSTQTSVNTIDTNVDSILADTSTDGVAISASTITAMAEGVWDESTSAHVAAGSFGATNQSIRSATAQGGTSTTIQLDASASAVDDFYNNTYVYILSGTGALQGRFITDYVGSSTTATVDTWVTTPDATSVFSITPFGTLPGASAPTASQNAAAVWDRATASHTTLGTFGTAQAGLILREETAQGGGPTTITLDAGASATNETYRYSIVLIRAGTGAGQGRQISGYVGSSKVATVSLAWATQPDATSEFQIVPLGVDAATIASIADGVWDEQRAGHVAAGSFGERVLANMTQISGDSIAADNLESYCDGTTPMPNNVIEVDGVAAAAAALSDAFDGTGGVTIDADLAGSATSITGAINTGAGTIQTLDALDTAQDTQHTTTQGIANAIETDTQDIQTTLGAAVGADLSADIAAVQTDTTAILVDTADISNIETDTQDIQNRIPAALAAGGSINSAITHINDVAITGDGSGTPFDV